MSQMQMMNSVSETMPTEAAGVTPVANSEKPGKVRPRFNALSPKSWILFTGIWERSSGIWN